MVQLTNKHTGDLILPEGTAIRRNGPAVTVPAETWAKCIKSPVVKAWVDTGMLVISKAKADDTGADDDALAKLRAEAEDLGIKVDARWKAPRLEKEIEKAKAGESDDDGDEADDATDGADDAE